MTDGASIEITVPRSFRSAPERVFSAWIDPAMARRFLFATKAGTIVACEIDARAGGAYRIVDRRDGGDVEHVGTYREVAAPRRLAFTLRVPKYAAGSTDVAVDIAAETGGAALVLTHAPVPAENAERVENGWRMILDALADVLGER